MTVLLTLNIVSIQQDTSGIYWSRVYKTGTYNLVVSRETGELQLAVGDMQINESVSTSLVKADCIILHKYVK